MKEFKGSYNFDKSKSEMDLSKKLKVATKLIEQCYLDKSNKQIFFQSSLDLEEFYYPIFNALRDDQDTYNRLPLRTTTVKAIADFNGCENSNEFWSKIVLSYFVLIKKYGTEKANASLLHLKDTFRRIEYLYFKFTEPIKDVHLAFSKSDFESDQKLIKKSHYLELDRLPKELYLQDIYLLVYYGAHLLLYRKKDDEKYKSAHCKAFGIKAEDYDESIESFICMVYQYALILTIVGIRVSALTFCLDNQEATGEGLSTSTSGDIDGSEWRTTSKIEYFMSPEIKSSYHPNIKKKRGRPNEKTFQEKEFIELVRRLAADKDYQFPNGAPVPTRIRDEIHLGDYKEKGLLKATRLFTKVKQALEIIEKENRIKDQKGDSGGTGNLDGK